ncbi:MAG: hypothetical protein ACR2HI_05190 [Gaiella sp.]
MIRVTVSAMHRPRSRRRLGVVIALVASIGGSAIFLPSAASRPAEDECGLPTTIPLWIEYGEGSVPAAVRDVFSRPGVVVAASGTFLPTQYRAKGARTTYWVLKLPKLVGTPSEPADPAGIQRAADTTFNLAVKSTTCATPWIALNELAGPAAPVPWTDTTRQYRANVLALVRRLAERGARPALLVHGNTAVAGEAGPWWREIGASAHVVYEAYYNAQNIHRLGRIVGPRRVRLGMRSVVRLFASVGVPKPRLGLMLGFQVAPGKAGREGLQPSQAWYRFVKWNALAARQVAQEEKLATVWSWGWGNLGPQASDPDKPTAACVYLWARDSQLCDGVAAAGPGFDRSLVEGAIVIPTGITCISVLGKLPTRAVDELGRVTKSRQLALDGLFARAGLAKRYPVASTAVDAVERDAIARSFAGSSDAYLAELQRRGATRAIARSIIADELRRRQLAASAAPGTTALGIAADASGFALGTATCLGDLLPGSGDFPRSDVREIGAVPLAAFLPFLFADVTPPAPPLVTATPSGTTIVLDWNDGMEADLAGYHVDRVLPGSAPVRLTRTPLTRSTFTDRTVPFGTTPSYVVRAFDTSSNAAPAAG